MRIVDLLEKLDTQSINLTPAYQRKEVWKPNDEKLLIDSILMKFPIPEVMVHSHMKDGEKGYRSILDVIDGKQRITTIHKFATDGFKIPVPDTLLQLHNLEHVITTKHSKNKKVPLMSFSELPKELKQVFLGYQLRQFELIDEEFNLSNIFNIFVRINKTGQKLKPQEIRNALFADSPLMEEARKLAEKSEVGTFLERHSIVSKEEKKRMLDVEFVLELLVLISEGIQDKKKTLDKVIGREKELTKNIRSSSAELKAMIKRIGSIIPNLLETRLRKRSDFYSLVTAISELAREGYNVENEEHYPLVQKILTSLSNAVDELAVEVHKNKDIGDPAKKDEQLFKYFTATQHSTDTKEHRKIRADYIKHLIGSAIGKKDGQRLFTPEQKRLLWNSSAEKICKLCKKPITSWDNLEIDHIKPWSKQGSSELENGQLAHEECNARKGNKQVN